MSNTKAANPWTWDLRVRERNLRAGTVDVKEQEKYLSSLPDVADQATPFSIDPPNFEATAAPDADDDDNDDDDEE